MKTNLFVRTTRAARHGGCSLRNPAGAWAACWLLLLAGCADNAAIQGLRPVSPPPRLGPILSGSSDPIVASNPPMLEWEAYVPPQQSATSDATPSRVTYDLWIWQNRLCSPSRLIYAKTGLSAPRHQVERQLKPATGYFWSVRARVQTGGETRYTVWTRVLLPTHPITRPNQPGDLAAFDYFRFVTPGGVNDESKSELGNWREIFAASTPSAESDAGNERADASNWGSLFAEFPGM